MHLAYLKSAPGMPHAIPSSCRSTPEGKPLPGGQSAVRIDLKALPVYGTAGVADRPPRPPFIRPVSLPDSPFSTLFSLTAS